MNSAVLPKHPNAENQMLAHFAKRKCIQLVWILTVVALGLGPLAPHQTKVII